MIKRLQALFRRLTEPNDNIWLALLAAVIGLLVGLWLLGYLAPLLEQLGR